jgi:hypothetical protein
MGHAGAKQTLSSLSLDVSVGILTKLFAVEEEGQPQAEWIISAIITCQSLSMAWKELKSKPYEHGLFKWLTRTRPHKAATILLKLGVQQPAFALKSLAKEVGEDEQLLRR